RHQLDGRGRGQRWPAMAGRPCGGAHSARPLCDCHPSVKSGTGMRAAVEGEQMSRFIVAMACGVAVACAALGAQGSTFAAADPLQTRATISFRDAAAADVLRTVAAGAGVNVSIAAGNLRPVTITLTNVKLATALDAVCDNALCTWRFAGALQVTPL